MFEPILIFVYGTLKRWYHNNAILHDSEFIGEDCLKCFGLTGNGFPFAHLTDLNEGAWLHWEVFKVTSPEVLARLDSLEGHPNWYCRKEYISRKGKKVWAYHMEDEAPALQERFLKEGTTNEYEWKRLPI